VGIAATLMSVTMEATMYEMVEMGYSVTLVVAFVPLVCGIYWPRATTQGAVLSILLSVPIWVGFKYLGYNEESEILWQCVPPQLYGLAASFVGMIVGSLLPQLISHTQVDQDVVAGRRSVSLGH
jgi:Na+/proline symporter